MKLKTILIFFIFLIAVPMALGWGEGTHLNITTVALSGEDTLISNIIRDNLDACYSGLEYPDVGIFYYYTNFKVYAGLHNYNTVDEMLKIATTDRQRAFTYCYKLHLAEDGISHNYYVPYMIKKYKLNNYLIHPVVELKIENFYTTISHRENRLMENHAEFDPFVQKATGQDWSKDAEKLNKILGGGNLYSEGFTDSTTTWGKFMNGMYKFIALFTSPKSSVDYYNLAIGEAKNVLEGQTSRLDPSGEQALADADSSSALFLYGGTFIFALIFFIISIRLGWIWFFGLGKK